MSDTKATVVFAGQGSQRPGMGKDFHDAHPVAREIFERAGETLGEDIAAICFADDDARLNLTEFTQPCILTMEMAVLQTLKKTHGFAPSLFAGHSLGEYSALAAADAIPFEIALSLVRLRGQLMQRAVPEGVGAMAAVIHPALDRLPIVETATRHGAEPANLNAPDQIVLSGTKAAVEAAAGEIETMQLDGTSPEVRFLEVSAPFHCSLMKTIEPEFEAALRAKEADMNPDRARQVMSNFTGAFHSPEAMVGNLVRQISGPVRWIENMRGLSAAGAPILEIGPNRPLQRFFAGIGVEVQSIINVRSMNKAFGGA